MVVENDWADSSDDDHEILNMKLLAASQLGLPVNKRMMSKNSAFSKASDSTVDTSASCLHAGDTGNQYELEMSESEDQQFKLAFKSTPRLAEGIVLTRQKPSMY